MSSIYNSYFFNEFYAENGGGNYMDRNRWMPFFSNIADKIIEMFNPKTVLDAGCATGYLVEALRNKGVEAYGVDISEYAISNVAESIQPYCEVHSITDPLPDTFPKYYDLIITIEVLEHLYPEEGKKAINNLCNYSDKIIFTSTPDDLEDITHVNVQPREYWTRLFAENSFYRDLIHPLDFICPWAMLFVKRDDVAKVIGEYEINLRILNDKMKQMQKKYNEAVYTSILFFDFGDGFSEHDIVLTDSCSTAFFKKYEISPGVKSVRFDPVEGKGCIVQNIEIVSDKGPLIETNLNGFRIDNFYIFTNTDPQILINLNNEPISYIQIKATIIPFDDLAWFSLLTKFHDLGKKNDEFQAKIKEKAVEKSVVLEEKNALVQKIEVEEAEITSLLAVKEKMAVALELKDKEIAQISKLKESTIEEYIKNNKKLENELNNYKAHYLAAINQREELTHQLAQTNGAYELISNSTCWKFTKPLRVILDLIKKLLKSNSIMCNFCKVIKSLKRHGVKYTWYKVKMRFSTKGRINEYYKTQALSEAEIESQKGTMFSKNIKFSILVPLYNTPPKYLIEMIESVVAQTYSNWELCLADGSDAEHAYVRNICNKYSQKDNRIIYKKLEQNMGISENSNICATLAKGEYLALLDHDDILSPNALYENVLAINKTGADIVYSDEDHIDKFNKHNSPFFKPDWSIDLLYSQMYVCHFMVFKRTLFEKVGGFRADFDGSQDYDLILRLSEISNNICHIPKLLYSWRESSNSTAVNPESKPYAHMAGLNALNDHLKRKYGEYAHAENSEYNFVYDARFNLLKPGIKVSIIIPMKDKSELTNKCVQSILTKTTYTNYEILLINNRSSEENTYKWFEMIQKKDNRIKIVNADIEFNWSKINNIGIKNASGEVYVFLNNDTTVITGDWLERLCENALREDIGVVGGLLLYEDNKIQHAGVVVGLGGWADHVYKNMDPIHYGCPFVSPMVNRNVLAVTGACMAISRKTIDLIGLFNEEFIICGSDVEICLRSYEAGLNNLYNARVKLYHLEAKSRDSYIPEKDFEMSEQFYSQYKQDGDPYYNVNLSLNSIQPKEKSEKMDIISFKNYLKHNKLTAPAYNRVKKIISDGLFNIDVNIPEIQPIEPCCFTEYGNRIRLNLLIPSIDRQHAFGGISTAIKFFTSLVQKANIDARIIVTDSTVNSKTSIDIKGYTIIDYTKISNEKNQIIDFSDRCQKVLPVAKNDIFIATGWWTAYNIIPVIRWQAENYELNALNSLIYFIQDYEPGFYPWSSRYLMADSTYKSSVPTIAIFNSKLLKDYFHINNYKFKFEYYFEPSLNDNLKKYFFQYKNKIKREKQILVYGRPTTQRNAFELIVLALKEWCKQQERVNEWTILSAGEAHPNIDLGKDVKLCSVGKLSLEEYAKIMFQSYVGISLMVSPHPSYPPLEMSTFGIKTITNCFSNKNLASFNDNIISIQDCSSDNITKELLKICNNYNSNIVSSINKSYFEEDSAFDDIIEDIVKNCFKQKV